MHRRGRKKPYNKYVGIESKMIETLWNYWHRYYAPEYLKVIIEQILEHVKVYRAHPKFIKLRKYQFSYFPYCIQGAQERRATAIDSRGHIFLAQSMGPSRPREMNEIYNEIYMTEFDELHPTFFFCVTNHLFYPAKFILSLASLNLGNFELELALSWNDSRINTIQGNLQRVYFQLFSKLMRQHFKQQIQQNHFRLEDLQLNMSLAELLLFYHFLPALKSKRLLRRYMNKYGFEFSENKYIKRYNGHAIELIGSNIYIDHKYVCIQFREEPVDLDENDRTVAKLLALIIPGIRYDSNLSSQLSPYYKILEEMFDIEEKTESEEA